MVLLWKKVADKCWRHKSTVFTRIDEIHFLILQFPLQTSPAYDRLTMQMQR